MYKDLTEALTEGLTALTKQQEVTATIELLIVQCICAIYEVFDLVVSTFSDETSGVHFCLLDQIH